VVLLETEQDLISRIGSLRARFRTEPQ